MVLIQLGIYFIPCFVLVNGSCGKKGKRAYLQKNEISRQTGVAGRGEGVRGWDWSLERRQIVQGFFLVLISICSSCFFWLFSLLLRATRTIPWFIWRENWIKNGKEADMRVWQLVLTPTHWESKEVYCFSWYLVFGDILFVAVIFKAIQLLYFERWVWESLSFPWELVHVLTYR